MGIFIPCDCCARWGIGKRVDVDAPSRCTACLASIISGGIMALLQGLWVIGPASVAGNIFIDTDISLVVAAYVVWFTHRKAGRDLLR